MQDLLTVRSFRAELGKHPPIFKTGLDITASHSQVAEERKRQEYATRQNSIVASLAMSRYIPGEWSWEAGQLAFVVCVRTSEVPLGPLPSLS